MKVDQKKLYEELYPDRLKYIRYFVKILRMRLVTHRPVVLSHMITSRCDCKCVLCPLWKLGKKDELSTDQIYHMLDMAKNEGMIGDNIWGGEPLLREDLPEVLGYAKRNHLHTSVITNGNILPYRIDGIAPSLNTLIVSIDYVK